MKEPAKPSNDWICLQCPGKPSFEHPAMMEHLKNVHQIDTKNTKGSRALLAHIDGSDFFTYTWEWTIRDLKFVQNIVCPRNRG